MTASLRRVISLLLGITLMLVFLWLFSANANWSKVRASVLDAQLVLVLWSALPLFLAFGIRLYRWWFILSKHAPDIAIRKCFTPYFSSFAINNVLPFRLGDVARATLFNKDLGTKAHAVVASLISERVLDLSSLLLMFFIASLFLGGEIFNNSVFVYVISLSGIILLLIMLLVLFPGIVYLFLEKVSAWVEKAGISFLRQVIGFIREIVNSFYINSTLGYSIFLFSLSVLAWFFEVLAVWLVVSSLDIEINFQGSAFVMSVSTLSTLLPSTPGYVGTYDYLCKVALELLNVEESRAIAATLLTHFMNIAPITLVGGTAFIFHFGRNWRKKLKASFDQASTEEA